MKRIIFLLTLIVLTGFGSIAQITTATVSGTVTSITTGQAVPNHLVSVTSLDSTLMLYADAMTDASGYYAISFTVPPGMFLPQLLVSTFSNCATGDIYTSIITPVPMGNTVNFSICTSSTTTNCNAEFVIIPNLPPVPDVFFSDISTGSVVSWYWDFGDGTMSTLQNPNHVFPAAGLYEVCLTILTSDSCVDSYCEWVTAGGIITPNCTAVYDHMNVPGTVNTVEFVDVSSTNSNILEWVWDFGDGTIATSTVPLVSHVYSPTGPGIYEVCMTIFTADSCTDTYCEWVVPDTMGTNFCESSFYYAGGGSIVAPGFHDASYASSPIISWYWDFGDGNTSYLQNPQYNYANVGVYNVCLTIVTLDSCTSTFCDSVYYQGNNFCSADFAYTNPGPAGNMLEVLFSDVSFGNVVDWSWDFGDGTFSSIANPTHIYSSAGVYQVCLDIFTSDSCASTYCNYILVGDSIINPPGCDAFFYAGGTGGMLGMSFFDVSYATTPIISWNWTFGDGSTSYDQNPNHVYNAAGWYTVCLTILSTDSCTSTYCEDVYYGGSSTLCSAGYYYTPGVSGSIYDFAFTDMSMGTVIDWYWDFGDGTTSGLQNPLHTFSSVGLYDVCLTIFTADSCASTYCEYIYVDTIVNPPMCETYFYYGSNPGTSGLTFYDMSYAATPIISWEWTFGDGTSSYDQNPMHSYNAIGWYTVCLTTISLDSCISSYCEQIYYGGGSTLCSAGFYYSQAPSGTIYDFAFADMSMGSVIEWNWSFGDGTTSNLQNPYHTYSQMGAYEVCLSIFTADSCSSTWCEYVYVDSIINPPGCDAYFAYDIGIFANSSFYDMSYSSSPIISWYWEFGDGTTSYDQNPIHPYNAIGWYNACLTIMTLDSCTSTYCENVYYSGQGGNCEAFFTALQSPISNPLEVSFIDNSVGSVISWTWSFGDGSTSTDQNPVHLYSAPGQYEVCLAIFTSDSCASTYCEYVTVQTTTPLYTVSGSVWAGVDAVNNGIAMLMGNTGSFFVEDIAFGSYLFNDIPAGTYILYAIPSFVDYPNYAPTYHDTALFWSNAVEVVVAANVYPVDVHLQEVSLTTLGPGTISGTILWNTTLSVDTYKDRNDASVGDISLLLFNMDDVLLEHTASNELGEFEFDELPYGTYKLIVELTGHITYPAIITLDEGNSVVDDIFINVANGEIIFDVDEVAGNINNINLYPNPVTDNLYVEFEMESNSYLDISILNAFGQEVIYQNESLTVGNHQLRIDVADLASGIYFITLKEENSSKVLKFVK